MLSDPTRVSPDRAAVACKGRSAMDPVAHVRLRMHSRRMANRNRTPQEKKALSLALDRRNTYGNNQKAARKAIPRRKASENRRNRHKTDQALVIALSSDDLALDLAESSARNDVHRVGGWRKGADTPLGEVIALQLEKRDVRIGRKDRARADRS